MTTREMARSIRRGFSTSFSPAIIPYLRMSQTRSKPKKTSEEHPSCDHFFSLQLYRGTSAKIRLQSCGERIFWIAYEISETLFTNTHRGRTPFHRISYRAQNPVQATECRISAILSSPRHECTFSRMLQDPGRANSTRCFSPMQ